MILVLVLAGRVRSVDAEEAVEGVLAETLETTEETMVRSTAEYVSSLKRSMSAADTLTLVLKLVKPRVVLQFVLEVCVV